MKTSFRVGVAVLLSGCGVVSAQTMTVKILERHPMVEVLKSRKLPDAMSMSGGVDDRRGLAPGDASAGGDVNARRFSHGTNGAISGGPNLEPVRGVSGREKPDTYRVMGMRYRLLRPDGRVAEVSCVSKHDWDGGAETRRSCRAPHPQVNAMQAKFDGEKVKLSWTAGLRHGTKISETYELVGLATP